MPGAGTAPCPGAARRALSAPQSPWGGGGEHPEQDSSPYSQSRRAPGIPCVLGQEESPALLSTRRVRAESPPAVGAGPHTPWLEGQPR